MSYNPFSLEGKTILVTGASSGIGRATAIECSKMGATMVISGRNEERLNETFKSLEGEGHTQIVADLVEEDQIENLVKQLPKLNGVVLCAGISTIIPVQFSTREKFDKTFNINFFSQAEILRLVFKKKILQPEGSAVLISSIGGVKRSTPGNGIYGASKAALSTFAKFAALEFASRKIRVNCICPGMTETPLIRGGSISDEQYQADMDRLPFKRYGTPEEMAFTAIFLLSDAASYISGQDIVVDGANTR